jgi:hypothetical protein
MMYMVSRNIRISDGKGYPPQFRAREQTNDSCDDCQKEGERFKESPLPAWKRNAPSPSWRGYVQTAQQVVGTKHKPKRESAG